ncbi:MAG: DMT family transporter [Lachnospiraceae bacterium]|nr:DMT family transporter [Lachnospiraceae bacterium]
MQSSAEKYGRFLAIFPCMLWGMAFPAIKIGYDIFGIASSDSGGQILFAGIRFFLAGILAWSIGSVIHKKPLLPKRSSLYKIAVLSLFQTFLQYMFFYIGLAHTTGVKGSIINASNTFFALFISAVIFRQERMTIKKWLGLLVGFGGVVVVNLSGDLSGSMSLHGEGFMLISGVMSAFSSVLIKKYTEDELAFTLSSFQFMLGGAGLAAAGLISKSSPSASSGIFTISSLPSAIAVVLILAGISAIAYSSWGVLLNRYEVSGITVFGFLIPIFGSVFSIIALKEDIRGSLAGIIIALILVSAGTLLVQTPDEKNQA